MIHGDDSGLILPPRIAPYQVVVVPIPKGDWHQTVLPHAGRIKEELEGVGIRVMLDDREEHSPGWKYAEWEMRGVPVRLEIGPRDIKREQVMLVRRDSREKLPTQMDGLATRVKTLLAEIQVALFDRAVAFREKHTFKTRDQTEFNAAFEGRPGYVISPWCGSADCEAQIKAATQATIRNLPLTSTDVSGACIQCGKSGKVDAYFAKSY